MSVTIASSVILLLEFTFIVFFVLYARKKRISISKESILWFVPIFLFLLSLYLVVIIESDSINLLLAITQSIVASLKTFTFEINVNLLQHYLHIHTLFTVVFYLTYFLAVFTILSSIFSLIKNQLFNYLRVRKLISKTCDLVIDFNNTSLIYENKHKERSILWLTKPLDKEKINHLYENKTPFIQCDITQESLTKYLHKNVHYNFVVFETNPKVYQHLLDSFSSMDGDTYDLSVYFESKFDEIELIRQVYLNQVAIQSHFKILSFSRYEMIAQKFVSNYTIPSMLSSEFFNANRTIKDQMDINVFFCGFGKLNVSMFEMFVQNNQLVTEVNQKLKTKPVHYYVIDKEQEVINTHQIDLKLHRFRHLTSDLPLMENLCEFHQITGDIKSVEVATKIKSIIEKKNTVNFFIVSFGNDFENAAFSKDLTHQYQAYNIHVACRLKHLRLSDKNITYFGNEEDIIDHEHIIDDDLHHFAMNIYQTYQDIKEQRGLSLEDYRNSMPSIEYLSNLYTAINLRFKLHLLDLDITKDPNVIGLSKDEFMGIYGSQQLNRQYDDYFGLTTRNVVAFSEKLRWNAFYLFQGYQPMRLHDITITPDKVIWKNHRTKTHACLTTHQGLDALHQYVLSHQLPDQNLDIMDIESYQYDYMCFDHPDNSLIDKLDTLGYKIYKRNVS